MKFFDEGFEILTLMVPFKHDIVRKYEGKIIILQKTSYFYQIHSLQQDFSSRKFESSINISKAAAHCIENIKTL